MLVYSIFSWWIIDRKICRGMRKKEVYEIIIGIWWWKYNTCVCMLGDKKRKKGWWEMTLKIRITRCDKKVKAFVVFNDVITFDNFSLQPFQPYMHALTPYLFISRECIVKDVKSLLYHCGCMIENWVGDNLKGWTLHYNCYL